MNINNTIVVRRGVKFEDPGASALTLNAHGNEEIFGQDLAYLDVATGGKELTAFNPMTFTGADAAEATAFIVKLKASTNNLLICYQGAEEPYNQPNVAKHTSAIPAAMQSLLKPAGLFVRLSDLIVRFDPTRIIAASTANAGTLVIADLEVGKLLVLVATGAFKLELDVVDPSTFDAATMVSVGLINLVDLSNPSVPAVEIIC